MIIINVNESSNQPKDRAFQIGHSKRSNNILFIEDIFTTKEKARKLKNIKQI